MFKKIYFSILLLCGIWSPGITATFADEDIGESSQESSNFLIRQKRVVSYVPGERITVTIRSVPHVVVVRESGRMKCVGNILSLFVVITISNCVTLTTEEYQILAGTSRSDQGNNYHAVIDIRKKLNGNPSRPADGIALLTVHPPFVYGSYTQPIALHSGTLLQGTVGFIFGWGYNDRCTNHGTTTPFNIRRIEVEIMGHRDCANVYRNLNIVISEKEVCTYHSHRHCGHTDSGAPLVVDRHLAGIHLWTGPIDRGQNDDRYPDVFLMLQNSAYNQWIMRNLHDIETHYYSYIHH